MPSRCSKENQTGFRESVRLAQSDHQNKKELDNNTRQQHKVLQEVSAMFIHSTKSLLYILNISISSQLIFCMLHPSKWLCATYILLSNYLLNFPGHKYCNAYLPNVALLCCSPACLSLPCVE